MKFLRRQRPLVLVHARALLKGTPEGRTGYIHADLQDPPRFSLTR